MGDIIWLQNDTIKAGFCPKRGTAVTIKSPSDPQDTEFLLTPEEFPEFDGSGAAWLGSMELEVKRGSACTVMQTSDSSDVRTCFGGENYFHVEYSGNSCRKQGVRELHINENFLLMPDGIRWDIRIQNTGREQAVIRKLGIPLLMNQYFRGDDAFKYEQCVMRHSCITGAHSWFYWEKSSGDMPVLLLQALESTGIYHFERCRDAEAPMGCRTSIGKAFEGLFRVYPYHTPTVESHLDCSEKIMEPQETLMLSFMLSMQSSLKQINRKLKADGGIGVEAEPGMCVPKGSVIRLRLYAQKKLELMPECIEDEVLWMKPSAYGYDVQMVLNGYGIRKVQIMDGSSVMVLSFFGMEEPGEIYDRNADFIAENQFETEEADPCFHGLLMWDMSVKGRINSRCNPYGPDWFAGGSDEIGLVSGVFLSEKNVYRPKEKEIRVLQMYLKDFIEERLTEQPGDKVHRMVPWYVMFDDWKGQGADDIWRAFNYVHIINTYFNMYRIQKIYGFDYLEKADCYLKRAYDYTTAMFTYWMFPDGVGALQYANMGEMTIPLELEQALAEEGMTQEAENIRQTVLAKASYFASKRYPFGSEMAYDSTAFEAVYAYGKRIGSEHVMISAANAALANRGCQPVWYLYRTDLRQMGDSSWNVSYMTQLGAYGFYDWTLEQNHKDIEMIKAFYASYLSGFAIYNSGGFWNSEPENRGASAWIISGESGQLSGAGPDGTPYSRGCVPMSGESALGYFGALRTASSILICEEDGELTGLGCRVQTEEDAVKAVLCDGLQMRWFDLVHDWAVKLERDSILETVWSRKEYRIRIENYTKDSHVLKMQMRMPHAGRYCVQAGNCRQEIWLGSQWRMVSVPVDDDECIAVVTEMQIQDCSTGIRRTRYEG